MPPNWYSAANDAHPMSDLDKSSDATADVKPSQVHDAPRREASGNEYLFGKLELQTASAKRWKWLWMREVMRSGNSGAGSVPLIYTTFDRDHAEAEAAFWDAHDDGRGNVLVERSS